MFCVHISMDSMLHLMTLRAVKDTLADLLTMPRSKSKVL